MKEEKDEATMLQAKAMCNGDAIKIETSYYKLRYQQMLESGDIENLKKEILTEKRRQDGKQKDSVLKQVLGPQTPSERQARIEAEVDEIVRRAEKMSSEKKAEEEAKKERNATTEFSRQCDGSDPEDESVDLENRTLCSDENCIGIMGPDGRCTECGRRLD